jgi:2-C-methyl-D-erythritol 4-phosphate cytidylyltransferase
MKLIKFSSTFVSMKKTAIIVAGGAGVRMGSAVPKQFLLLHKVPVLMHTLEAFYSFDREINIILVLPDHHRSTWEALCRQYRFRIPHQLVQGGNTRFHSVKNGMERADDEGLIAIHDGVRPLVSQETLRRCFLTAAEKGSAVPVINPSESLRKVDDGESIPVDRSEYRLVQTPQVFRAAAIREAYRQEYNPAFTDDATVAEGWGIKIYLVEGNTENIKITSPLDMRIAGHIMKNWHTG